MAHIFSKRSHIVALIAPIILVLIALSTAAPTYAAGIVTNCSNDTDFSNKLAGGGTITFNCGTATIVLTSTKTITADTVIDGANKITLSGGECAPSLSSQCRQNARFTQPCSYGRL